LEVEQRNVLQSLQPYSSFFTDAYSHTPQTPLERLTLARSMLKYFTA
jgi:hypothetical protein